MIAFYSFAAFLALVALSSLLGRRIRRQRKRQFPTPYVVRDERLEIPTVLRRRKP